MPSSSVPHPLREWICSGGSDAFVADLANICEGTDDIVMTGVEAHIVGCALCASHWLCVHYHSESLQQF